MLEKGSVFLALGSNLGEKRKNLKNARKEIEKVAMIHKCSAIYETEPFGVVDQPLFYNQVIKITTTLSPETLLERCKSIEKSMGRTPTVRNGPRIIDVDILFYGNTVINTSELSIPHSGIEIRAFVLIPLAEIAPSFMHPVLHKTVEELCLLLPRNERRKCRKIE